jgi:hypothetical protein
MQGLTPIEHKLVADRYYDQPNSILNLTRGATFPTAQTTYPEADRQADS